MRRVREWITARLAIVLFFFASQFGIFPVEGAAFQETGVQINGSQVASPDDKPYIDAASGRGEHHNKQPRYN